MQRRLVIVLVMLAQLSAWDSQSTAQVAIKSDQWAGAELHVIEIDVDPRFPKVTTGVFVLNEDGTWVPPGQGNTPSSVRTSKWAASDTGSLTLTLVDKINATGTSVTATMTQELKLQPGGECSGTIKQEAAGTSGGMAVNHVQAGKARYRVVFAKNEATDETATENAIGNLMDGETPAPAPAPDATESPTPTPDATESPTPTPDATKSPTPTPSPTSSPTEDKDSALRSALQKLPEYAGLPQEQLDRVIAKFKDTSLTSNWSDAMKAEMEWYKKHGVEPGHPIIKAATPKPTPIAELRAPYDWIRHTRRESDLAAAIQQLNTRLKEGLDEHTQNSERQAELRRELEILRHVRQSLIRSPARSLPRLPARR